MNMKHDRMISGRFAARLGSVLLIAALILQLLCLSGAALADPVFAFESLEYSVNVSKTIDLKPILQGATLSQKAKYIWESEDPQVARVTNTGKVSGVAAGQTKIIVTVQDENDVSFTASCVVNVNQPVTKIKFAKETIKVAAGVETSIAPAVLPADASNPVLRFTSSDPSICKVYEDGRILGQTINKSCYITAEATDGSGIKAKVKVSVKTFTLDTTEVVLTERKTYELVINSAGYDDCSLKYKRNGIFKLGNLLEDMNNWYDVGWREVVDEETGKKENHVVLLIEPVKVGTQTLTLYDTDATWGTSGATKESIKITVKPSAVYDTAAFPALQYAKVAADPQAGVGQTVLVQGIIASVDDKQEDGILRYYIATKGNTENTVIAQVPDAFKSAADFRTGEKVKVFGVWKEPETKKTETGLQVVYPTLMIEKINDKIFNSQLTLQMAE